MLKEAGYQEKMVWLAPWLFQIIDVVKKDLKQEHLRIDREFCRRYFLGKGPQQVTVEQMTPAYAADIAAGNVGLGEFIATRWLIKHTDIYNFFEERLKELTPDFETLEQFDEQMGKALMEEAVACFGATKTYLFVVLNSVVFSQGVVEALRRLAEAETQQVSQKTQEAALEKTMEQMQKRHQREMQAMIDKHEKKFLGLQKKYLKDTEMLKRQLPSG